MKKKILLFDIETTPLISYTWGIYETDVVKVKEDWHILCYSYKWLGEKGVKARSLPDYPLYHKDKDSDLALIKDLWKLFNEADIIIGHNSRSFDVKKTQARFIHHRLPPPKPFEQIDTKLVAKRYFNFTSNKLDALGKYLGVGQKLSTGGFELWLDCMAGKPAAWKKMVSYNKQDVALLEQVYLKLLPWITNHPYAEVVEGCPNCGGKRGTRGHGYTSKGKYHRLYCYGCGAWSRGKYVSD